MRPNDTSVEGVVPFNRTVRDEPATAEERLQELLQRYGAFLRRTIARACPRTMGLSSDDIEQEAKLSLWNVLKSEREIAHPASYIYKVAVSATLRAIRRARARREEPLEDDSGAAEGGRSAVAPL